MSAVGAVEGREPSGLRGRRAGVGLDLCGSCGTHTTELTVAMVARAAGVIDARFAHRAESMAPPPFPLLPAPQLGIGRDTLPAIDFQ